MREIILDIETTGLSHSNGDRIIEIAALELQELRTTGRVFHAYINPSRQVAEEAVEIHGITDEFLRDKPLFGQIVDDFLQFIAGSDLVIHNADFDIGFLNMELQKLGIKTLSMQRVVDTLLLARKKFPNQSNSLDALCTRFNVEKRVKRKKHGALIDCELLLEVYIELRIEGGRQAGLQLAKSSNEKNNDLLLGRSGLSDENIEYQKTSNFQSKIIRATQEELRKHKELIDKLDDKVKPLWHQYQ